MCLPIPDPPPPPPPPCRPLLPLRVWPRRRHLCTLPGAHRVLPPLLQGLCRAGTGAGGPGCGGAPGGGQASAGSPGSLPPARHAPPPHLPARAVPPVRQGRWPNVERWFEAMEARPAYAGFKSDHYTHVHDLPPQLGGCVSGALCWGAAVPPPQGCVSRGLCRHVTLPRRLPQDSCCVLSKDWHASLPRLQSPRPRPLPPPLTAATAGAGACLSSPSAPPLWRRTALGSSQRSTACRWGLPPSMFAVGAAAERGGGRVSSPREAVARCWLPAVPCPSPHPRCIDTPRRSCPPAPPPRPPHGWCRTTRPSPSLRCAAPPGARPGRAQWRRSCATPPPYPPWSTCRRRTQVGAVRGLPRLVVLQLGLWLPGSATHRRTCRGGRGGTL